MAVPKRIKIGGGYYKGYSCTVNSASGEYNAILVNTAGGVLNSLSITPDQYGEGDTMKIEHYSDAAATGKVLAIVAEDIPNIGKGASILFDLPAGELVNNGQSIKFTYLNTASVAMNVNLIAEYVGIIKTA